MRYLIVNLKSTVLAFIKLSTFILSFYSAIIFFIVLLMNELFNGQKDPKLEEDLTAVQLKLENLPSQIKEMLKVNPQDEKFDVLGGLS